MYFSMIMFIYVGTVFMEGAHTHIQYLHFRVKTKIRDKRNLVSGKLKPDSLAQRVLFIRVVNPLQDTVQYTMPHSVVSKAK